MRINVYAEELTDRVELVEKTAENTGILHYGIRVYLESPDSLHNTPRDDTSAVTFWMSPQMPADKAMVHRIFTQALAIITNDIK